MKVFSSSYKEESSNFSEKKLRPKNPEGESFLICPGVTISDKDADEKVRIHFNFRQVNEFPLIHVEMIDLTSKEMIQIPLDTPHRLILESNHHYTLDVDLANGLIDAPLYIHQQYYFEFKPE